jgi:Zn-dependent peptidase ImmA (M78 family)
MHAMVIEDGGRHAILLGKDASYPAPIAFTLAHELGHIGLDHISGVSALVDLEDPATSQNKDDQEKSADEYALTLLTGRPHPKIETNIDSFNAPALAKAVIDAAPEYGIEPGTLALCLAYQRGMWPVAMSALKFIYGRAAPAWQTVNDIADSYLQWDEISVEAGDFVRNVMTDAHA